MPGSRPREHAILRHLPGLLLVAFATVFFALHFAHLTADFPNNSPWMDWAKYTDEGWYGDAAIRHFLTGHWYWSGDFNPAVALPVWPALELILFKFTGVTPSAARALTLCVFALTLVTLYILLQRAARNLQPNSTPLAGPLCVFFLCLSPYIYVFERMAILEPLLIALTALAILAARHLEPLSLSFLRTSPRRKVLRGLTSTIALGILIPAIVLTKTTGLFLTPAIFYMAWARSGYSSRRYLRMAVPPAAIALFLWFAYFIGFVRPHYLEDYRYLFSANAYTGLELQPLATIVLSAIHDGLWMGYVLYPVFFILVALALFWRPRLFAEPLFPTLLLWMGGYFAFLVYHNNLQPRYYLVIAVPITAAVALALDNFRHGRRLETIILSTLVAAVTLAIAIPDAILQLDFIQHPTYQFEAAAQSIKRIVDSDPTHSHLILSISGSDLSLMTGLHSIDDDFGTLDLDQRVAKYHPGWYIAWNELDDDKADAITPLYRPVRVAAFPALDDPDRNLLIVYRLDPKQPTPEVATHKRRIPKPLQTKLGQQPATTQLQH